MTKNEQAKLKAILYELSSEIGFINRFLGLTDIQNKQIDILIESLFDKPHKTNAKRR
jgi:hypothetical protein